MQNGRKRSLLMTAYMQRQMEQWITALEKTAAASHWTGSNRFGSFAPIRLNVAAQWLVDGVRILLKCSGIYPGELKALPLIARLLLESIESDSSRKGADLHSRLVVISWCAAQHSRFNN